MEKMSKSQKITMKVSQLNETKEYKNVEELNYDLNTRLQVALTIGYDPLEKLSITQIYEDIQTVNKLRDINLE